MAASRCGRRRSFPRLASPAGRWLEDGRSGSSTQKLKVGTHDVTVSDVVELLRRTPDGYHDVVGTVRGQVAKDGTVVEPFAYTYSADDAALGKVTLKARVRLDGRDDDNPGDNERQAETTVVAAK